MNYQPDIKTLKYLLFSAIILLPTIAFPISSDLSVFMHGGLAIANGGELYKDFFDIKPPIIYYIFAGLNYLFGDNVLVYRIFDFMYQMVFLFLCTILFSKLKVKQNIIRAFLILLPISYTILNYRDTLQVESLAFVPMLIYFYYLMKEKLNAKSIILLGLTLGISISLKYTLGIIFIASIPIFLNKSENRVRAIILLLTQLIIGVFVLLLTISPVIVQGNIDGLMATNKYLAEYSKYPPIGAELFREMLKSLAYSLGNFVTVTYLFFFLLASIFCIKKDKREVLKYSIIICFLLFISVLIERKANIYHLSRLYPFLILVVSYGFVYFFKHFKFRKNIQSLAFILIFLILSPFLRLINTYKIAYDRVFNYEEYVSHYTEDNTFNLLNNHLKIADYINKLNDDKFLLINTGGNQTIHYLHFKYKYKFPHSAFHLSPIAPELYKKAFEMDLHDADIVAIDSSDSIYMIFLSEGSSYDLFFKNQEYKDYLEQNFSLDTVLLDRYFIYKRNKI